jgi:hypothetical protein
MTIELTEKFIGFVDIMGFKSLMARADSGNGMSHSELFDISKLLGSDRHRAERVKYGSKICPHAPFVQRDLDFHITQQFDCAVVSAELSPAGAINVLSHCWEVCFALLGKGLMCRGYIKRGLIYHTEKDVFGPGHVDVVEGEKQVSFFKNDTEASGTPFIEVDPGVVDYVATQPDACVKTMAERMVRTEGGLTAIFPIKRLNHSFMIGGFGMPKFDPEKEKKSLNNVRGWIRRMRLDVEAFIDPANQSAVAKGAHYVRMLDQQLIACDKTEQAIDSLSRPFPGRTYTKKDFPGLG